MDDKRKNNIKNNDERQSIDEELTFDSLYGELFGKFVWYIKQIVNDKKIAEDIVQECFIIAYKKQNVLLSSPNPRGWLFWVLKIL
jgi:DNA-directed RNA polymerase specialized sigma subunit, sigma24 homolog